MVVELIVVIVTFAALAFAGWPQVDNLVLEAATTGPTDEKRIGIRFVDRSCGCLYSALARTDLFAAAQHPVVFTGDRFAFQKRLTINFTNSIMITGSGITLSS